MRALSAVWTAAHADLARNPTWVPNELVNLCALQVAGTEAQVLLPADPCVTNLVTDEVALRLQRADLEGEVLGRGGPKHALCVLLSIFSITFAAAGPTAHPTDSPLGPILARRREPAMTPSDGARLVLTSPTRRQF